jgi:phosphonopyruvate decarboxylase
MGCASSFGLGLAWARPHRKVVVLDGDGAALMRLGALATVSYERPKNLVHVLLDNEVHDSTGGQATVSNSVDLAAVAAACGYPRVLRCHTAAEVAAAVRDATELTFVHVKTAPGESGSLPRPKETPVQVIDRMRAWIAAGP